jgi:uncharacterized membrane protein
MSTAEVLLHRLEDEEIILLHRLRQARRHRLATPMHQLTFGAKIADAVAATMGSWPFIIVQSLLLTAWIILNITAYVKNWDPYPFILLNLALSFQAAYAAPFIMMSQNRQSSIDRQAAQHDYDTNTKAELEIEMLHQKFDLLREKEVMELIQIIHRLEDRIERLTDGTQQLSKAPPRTEGS